MASRLSLDSDIKKVLLRFNAILSDAKLDSRIVLPQYNISPHSDLPTIIKSNTGRVLRSISWGSSSSSNGLINDYFSVRAESIVGKGIYRHALRTRRCIIPATGFYLWSRHNNNHVYYNTLKSRNIFGIAGVWTVWNKSKIDNIFDSLERDEYQTDIYDLFNAISNADNQDEVISQQLVEHLQDALDQYTLPLRHNYKSDATHETSFLSFLINELNIKKRYEAEHDLMNKNISFVSITVPANQCLTQLTDRMPAILRPEDENDWLDTELCETEEITRMLTPYTSEQLETYRVRRAVSNPKYNAPDCIEQLKIQKCFDKNKRVVATSSGRRKTLRKRLIQKYLEEINGPVLLEELRWHVLREESLLKSKHQLEYLTRANLNSFARTIREHFPELVVCKLFRPENQPAGLVVRESLYRLSSWEHIQEFVNGNQPTVFCSYLRRETKGRKQVLLVFCKENNLKDKIKRSIRPINMPITLVSKDSWDVDKLHSLIEIPYLINRVTGSGYLQDKLSNAQHLNQISLFDSINPRWQKNKYPRTRTIRIIQDGLFFEESFVLKPS